jgi:hypothetical protein
VLVFGVASSPSKTTVVTPARPAFVPASWQKVTFGGLTMYAPRSWPVETRTLWSLCGGQFINFNENRIVLDTGAGTDPSSCPVLLPKGQLSGLLIDSGPNGPLETPYVRCLHMNGLSVCPVDDNGVLLDLAVHVPGRARPVAVEIGLAGGGKVAHTIEYSMRVSGPPATSKPYTGPPIRSMLLTPSDLPSGWAVDTSGNGSYLPADCGTDTPLETVHPGAYAAVTFSQTSNTAIELFEEVAFSDAAKSGLTTLKGILNACRAFSSYGATGTMTPLTFPRYTEQQAGFLIALPGVGGPVPWQLGFLIVRKGGYLVYLGYFPSTGPFNPRQLEPFVQAALARVPSS